MNYWIDQVALTLEGVGIVATEEQIREIAESMQIACEMAGLSCSHGEHPAKAGLRKVKKILEDGETWQRISEACPACAGTGYGGDRDMQLDCHKCNGKGRIKA
jgi:hypothetical protein